MLAVIPVTSTGDRGEGTYLRDANDTILNLILISAQEILGTGIGAPRPDRPFQTLPP